MPAIFREKYFRQQMLGKIFISLYCKVTTEVFWRQGILQDRCQCITGPSLFSIDHMPINGGGYRGSLHSLISRIEKEHMDGGIQWQFYCLFPYHSLFWKNGQKHLVVPFLSIQMDRRCSWNSIFLIVTVSELNWRVIALIHSQCLLKQEINTRRHGWFPFSLLIHLQNTVHASYVSRGKR